MATPRWGFFAGVTLFVLVAVLGLSRATARALSEPATAEGGPSGGIDAGLGASEPDLLPGAALSQALVGVLLAGLAWYAGIPPAALGIDDPRGAVIPGLALGVALYGANEAGVWLAARFGIESDDALRELLAPDTPAGWALLLFVVLPLVAVVEELLFRGALVGALAAGFPVSPWLLAVLSSVAFGLGHGLQGPGGIVVTGVLGFALAAAFVLTGSLGVVVIAHYLVNALEFLVHEGVGVEFGRG